jgi:hypothetical protein
MRGAIRRGLFNPTGIESLSPGLARFRESLSWVTQQNESATLKGLRHSIPLRTRVTKKILSAIIVFYSSRRSSAEADRADSCLHLSTCVVGTDSTPSLTSLHLPRCLFITIVNERGGARCFHFGLWTWDLGPGVIFLGALRERKAPYRRRHSQPATAVCQPIPGQKRNCHHATKG